MPGWSTKRYGSFARSAYRPAAAHEALDRDDGVLGIVGLVLAGRLADQSAPRRQGSAPPTAAAPPCVSGRHSARRGARRHQRMGGAQVDADGDAPLVRVGRLPGFGDLQQGHGQRVDVLRR
jgi:hypothetical protein